MVFRCAYDIDDMVSASGKKIQVEAPVISDLALCVQVGRQSLADTSHGLNQWEEKPQQHVNKRSWRAERGNRPRPLPLVPPASAANTTKLVHIRFIRVTE